MERSEWEIKWSDFLSVGIPEIDNQHRAFVGRVNDLNQAILEVKSKVTVERLMELMLTEATSHFTSEVELLKARQYPRTADHARKHQELIDQLNRLIEEIREDDLSFVWAVKGLRIKQLLVDHLLREDRLFKDYFAQQRPKPEP
jgi:hemerythrin